MYVYTCPSKVDMSLFLCLHTKILHVHIMFPPPLWVGWGGVLPSAAMYRYNYMFVCMYVSKQGRRVIFIVYANKDIVSVICMYVH